MYRFHARATLEMEKTGPGAHLTMAAAKGATGTLPRPIFARFIDNNDSGVRVAAARNSQLCGRLSIFLSFSRHLASLPAIVNERVIWSTAIETRFRTTA